MPQLPERLAEQRLLAGEQEHRSGSHDKGVTGSCLPGWGPVVSEGQGRARVPFGSGKGVDGAAKPGGKWGWVAEVHMETGLGSWVQNGEGLGSDKKGHQAGGRAPLSQEWSWDRGSPSRHPGSLSPALPWRPDRGKQTRDVTGAADLRLNPELPTGREVPAASGRAAHSRTRSPAQLRPTGCFQRHQTLQHAASLLAAR